MAIIHTAISHISRVALLGSLLFGCAGAQIEMSNSYPLPLVQPLSVHAGLMFDDAFRTYKYEESINGFGDWSVALGRDQQRMFEQTMRGLFRRFSNVSGLGQEAMGSELILNPSVAAFEISIPEQTQTEFFEVRIVYQISAFEPQGREVANWTVSAYGRSDTRNFRTLGGSESGSALSAATRTALRDASALISRQFPLLPDVKAWLAERSASAE